MTATTANVNVTISAKGTSPTNGLSFTFTAGAGLPAGVLSSDGSLDFTKAYSKGQVISIVFTLTTSSLTYGGTACPLSIYAQAGASNACWIGSAKPLTGPYSGTEFIFPPNAVGPGNASLSVTDNNDDGLTWYYELWVWVAGTVGQKFGHDPRIINHSTNE
jgi:hypothetical protein